MVKMTLFKLLSSCCLMTPVIFFSRKSYHPSWFFLPVLIITSLFILPNPAIADSIHGKGFIPESPAKYATMPIASRYRAFFSPETDLSGSFPKPGNQGKQGSCVAWATAYAVRSYIEANREGDHPNRPKTFLVRLLYLIRLKSAVVTMAAA